MKKENNLENTFVVICEHEAVLIAGGKDETIGSIVRAIGVGVGVVCKLGWKFLKAAQQCIAEQGAAGDLMIHK